MSGWLTNPTLRAFAARVLEKIGATTDAGIVHDAFRKTLPPISTPSVRDDIAAMGSLHRRKLVVVKGRGTTWNASITKAGTTWLEQHATPNSGVFEGGPGDLFARVESAGGQSGHRRGPGGQGGLLGAHPPEPPLAGPAQRLAPRDDGKRVRKRRAAEDLQDGVIVANPARVVDLVHLLRRHIVTVDGMRLAGQARQEKAVRLYEFITSDRCDQLLDEIDTVAEELLALDVKEVKAHEITWRQRGNLLRSVQRVRGSLVTEIEQITGTGAMEQSA